jgi:hypothetical protein
MGAFTRGHVAKLIDGASQTIPQCLRNAFLTTLAREDIDDVVSCSFNAVDPHPEDFAWDRNVLAHVIDPSRGAPHTEHIERWSLVLAVTPMLLARVQRHTIVLDHEPGAELCAAGILPNGGGLGSGKWDSASLMSANPDASCRRELHAYDSLGPGD